MAYANTQSYAAADANNNLRGLLRSNTTATVTATTSETDLSTTTITGGTITGTGLIDAYACGTISLTNGTKTIKMYFGGTAIATITDAAGTTLDWSIRAKISNTATNAQRIEIWRTADDGSAIVFDYTTLAIDTTSNTILKCTAQLGSGSDTVTQNKFEIFIAQVA